MSYLIDFLSEILAWLVDFVLWAAQSIYEGLLQAVAAVLDAIPVPSWLVGADPFADIDPGVVFFVEAFELPAGIAIILGAYFVRFLIRRIPIIG